MSVAAIYSAESFLLTAFCVALAERVPLDDVLLRSLGSSLGRMLAQDACRGRLPTGNS